MASTAEGRALTEANRRQQIAIGARADIEARALWGRLQADDIDGSVDRWLALNLATTRKYFNESAAVMSAYIGIYRDAELGAPAGRIVQPVFDQSYMADALVAAGPTRVKLLTKGGMSGTAAHGAAVRKYTGIVRRQVMSGGRMMIHETTKSDRKAVGWRRVTSSNPCAFCAMLASRGPVYSSKEKADSVAGSGLRYHGHCGCTAEIVYGEWTPTDMEQFYIDEYDKAAAQADAAGEARTQDTVLWRMRHNGTFKDSPLTRNI